MHKARSTTAFSVLNRWTDIFLSRGILNYCYDKAEVEPGRAQAYSHFAVRRLYGRGMAVMIN